MIQVFSFSEFEILAFFLVLVRMSSFVVAWPVFGTTSVPAPIKVLFALVLSLMIFPVVNHSQVNMEIISHQIILLSVKEAFIGLSFGFLARMFFFALRIAGEIISVTIGLSSSQLFNPAFGGNVSAVEQFKVIIATLFFLAINGHHLLLAGIIDSFRIIPLGPELINLSQLNSIGLIVQEIMVIGLKMASPVMISIFFMNITMAVIGRTVPQINVLITSLPVNIMVGLLVMFVTVPLLIWQMHGLLEVSTERLFALMKTY